MCKLLTSVVGITTEVLGQWLLFEVTLFRDSPSDGDS